MDQDGVPGLAGLGFKSREPSSLDLGEEARGAAQDQKLLPPL